VSRRRPPVLLREAVAAIGAHGHAVDVDVHSANYKITWQANGRRLLLVVARSPSDRRSAANARSVLRRLLAQEELPS
jgi:hypothetical protein